MKKNKFNYITRIALLASLPAVMISSCKKDDAVQTPPSPVKTTGIVTTVSGLGTSGFANGTASAALFSYPTGITMDGAGNLYIADQANNQIRKLITNATTGAVTASTLSGTVAPGSSNATAIGQIASFNNPSGVAYDATTGNIYVADFGNHTIRRITSAGAVNVFAGVSGSSGNNNDIIPATGTAQAINPRFNSPAGVAVDAVGNVYVADYGNNRIRKISTTGTITTVAGSSAGKVDGTGTAARFSGPRSVAVDAVGNIYVADVNNNLIRKVTADGVVTTFAGSGNVGNADGTGTAASFSHPAGVAVDAAGNVYVADTNNNLIRKITPAGVVTSLAGSGYLSLITPFNAPVAVAVDPAGTTVYVASSLGNTIQKVK
jgi:DNA-binding beta-propeller fold protein YncE